MVGRPVRRTARRTARRTSRRVSRRQSAMSGGLPPEEQDPRPTEPEAQPQPDTYEELKRAKELLDEGILTEEEFAAEKARLLGS